jgi:hypothetical protein
MFMKHFLKQLLYVSLIKKQNSLKTPIFHLVDLYFGFEFLTVVTMKSIFLLVVTPYS